MVDGHDWGTAAAAQAVRQLQAMGAQVYPQATGKDKMDWGVLAGEGARGGQREALPVLLCYGVINKLL